MPCRLSHLAPYSSGTSIDITIIPFMAPWRKRLDTSLPPLRSRIRVSVSPSGIWVSWWTKQSWVGFPRGSHVFPCHTFHSTISPHSSNSFRSISFHQPLWFCVRSGRPASLLFTDLQLCLHRISFLDTALCRIRVEDIFFYYTVRFPENYIS